MIMRVCGMKISVCMATYNGEIYLHEQLKSILKQISIFDEVIVSDDSSSDNTIDIISSFNDSRIKLLKDNKYHNPIYNFENALNNASGDIIVLADQDDIWVDGKIDIIRNNFNNNNHSVHTIVLNNYVIDKYDNVIHESFFNFANSGKGIVKNFIKNTYLGCNMAFSRSLLKIVLPFPKNIPMHDIWIGIMGNIYGNVEFIDKKTIMFRRHGSNYTKNRYGILQKSKWRYWLLINIFKRYYKCRSLTIDK